LGERTDGNTLLGRLSTLTKAWISNVKEKDSKMFVNGII
jgi:hypothetical protein